MYTHFVDMAQNHEHRKSGATYVTLALRRPLFYKIPMNDFHFSSSRIKLEDDEIRFRIMDCHIVLALVKLQEMFYLIDADRL